MTKGKSNVFKYINMMSGDSTVCWPWIGATGGKHGRPYIRYEGKVRTAYSVVYELTTGDIVGTRLIRHKCDNPICCNPKHLEIGTQKDNMRDMKERERHGIPKIVKNAWLKLYSDGVTYQTIAERYGVSATAVRAFIKQAESQAQEKLDAALAQQQEDDSESEDETCVQSESSGTDEGLTESECAVFEEHDRNQSETS